MNIDEIFAPLLKKMGASLLDYETDKIKLELKKLDTEGIVLTKEEMNNDIVYLEDNTIYDNKLKRRVVLYIRDVNSYGRDSIHLPKFHVTNCKTLQDMRQNGRYNRYVVTTNTESEKPFIIYLDDVRMEEMLKSCLNCAQELCFGKRLFSLKEYFAKYPKDSITQKPKYCATTQPINDYTKDWHERSLEAKRNANNTCQDCGAKGVGVELHTHHINGSKFDNSPSNLKVLCKPCHRKQPYHAHMLNDSR